MSATIEQTVHSLRHRRNRSDTIMSSPKMADCLALRFVPHGTGSTTDVDPSEDGEEQKPASQTPSPLEVEPTARPAAPRTFSVPLLLPSLLSIYALAGWVLFVALPLLPVIAAS